MPFTHRLRNNATALRGETTRSQESPTIGHIATANRIRLGWHLAIVVLSISTAALASGCGGSSPPQQERTTTSQSSAMVPEAKAICKKFDEKISASKPHVVGGRTSTHELALNALANAKLEKEAITELVRLHPPASLSRQWRQLIAYRQALANELIAIGHYWEANDLAKIKALAASKKAEHQALAAVASRAGLQACALSVT